ncbi:hypothetical protein [Streptomyces anatolicus]|nr:hypothetical protein [Streptomyces anatolicus]
MASTGVGLLGRTFDDYNTYGVKRDWAQKAQTKTSSRINIPKP